MTEKDIDEIYARVRALETWEAGHDGRIGAYWQQQHIWNDKIELRLGEVDQRLSELERRVVWFAGFAAGVGAIVGSWMAQAGS